MKTFWKRLWRVALNFAYAYAFAALMCKLNPKMTYEGALCIQFAGGWAWSMVEAIKREESQ